VIKTGNKEDIYVKLIGKRLTYEEIANQTNIKIEDVRSYIKRLRKEVKVKELPMKLGKMKIFTAIIEESNPSSIDTQILKKFLKPFIQLNVDIDLEVNETKRIKQLMKEVSFNA